MSSRPRSCRRRCIPAGGAIPRPCIRVDGPPPSSAPDAALPHLLRNAGGLLCRLPPTEPVAGLPKLLRDAGGLLLYLRAGAGLPRPARRVLPRSRREEASAVTTAFPSTVPHASHAAHPVPPATRMNSCTCAPSSSTIAGCRKSTGGGRVESWADAGGRPRRHRGRARAGRAELYGGAKEGAREKRAAGYRQ